MARHNYLGADFRLPEDSSEPIADFGEWRSQAGLVVSKARTEFKD